MSRNLNPKVSVAAADDLVMVMLQPIVIAINVVLIVWALRTLDAIEAAEG